MTNKLIRFNLIETLRETGTSNDKPILLCTVRYSGLVINEENRTIHGTFLNVGNFFENCPGR